MLLMAILPHGCCLFAASSGYWGATSASCHQGPPTLYATVELSGLLLALLVLLDAWRGANGFPMRGIIALALVGIGATFLPYPLLEQIALSALSKAGQGYLLIVFVLFVLRTFGIKPNSPFCPACERAGASAAGR